MPKLTQAVQIAIAELLAVTPYPVRFQNAPHIRMIGEKLQVALQEQTLPLQVWCECGHISGHHGSKYPHICATGGMAGCDKQCKGFVAQLDTLRADVQAFAVKMSGIMNEKEPDKGSVEQTPISEPLMKLDYLVGRLKEHGTLNPENAEYTKRLLVHIANFAMIAEGKL